MSHKYKLWEPFVWSVYGDRVAEDLDEPGEPRPTFYFVFMSLHRSGSAARMQCVVAQIVNFFIHHLSSHLPSMWWVVAPVKGDN
jgi:hypothetical protein